MGERKSAAAPEATCHARLLATRERHHDLHYRVCSDRRTPSVALADLMRGGTASCSVSPTRDGTSRLLPAADAQTGSSWPHGPTGADPAGPRGGCRGRSPQAGRNAKPRSPWPWPAPGQNSAHDPSAMLLAVDVSRAARCSRPASSPSPGSPAPRNLPRLLGAGSTDPTLGTGWRAVASVTRPGTGATRPRAGIALRHVPRHRRCSRTRSTGTIGPGTRKSREGQATP